MPIRFQTHRLLLAGLFALPQAQAGEALPKPEPAFQPSFRTYALDFGLF